MYVTLCNILYDCMQLQYIYMYILDPMTMSCCYGVTYFAVDGRSCGSNLNPGELGHGDRHQRLPEALGAGLRTGVFGRTLMYGNHIYIYGDI
jgi:hypothetical protein